MKKTTYLVVFLLLSIVSTIAQTSTNWTKKENSKKGQLLYPITKKSKVSQYQTYTLDIESLKKDIQNSNQKKTTNKGSNITLLDFPKDDGTLEQFSVEKMNVLHPDLEAKFPEIQSYYGVSTSNPLHKIYISLTPAGFTGIITGEKTIYIDPVDTNSNDYIVYDRKNSNKSENDTFVCNAIDEKSTTNKNTTTGKTTSTTDGKSRVYRIAIACTSEYSAYYGNTIAKVLAAMNTTITRVNSVYKRDLNLQFQIVANNDRLIFIDGTNSAAPSPKAEPYDNYDGTGMLNVNTSNINSIIGSGAYDIGHVFSTGGGGIAGTGPCGTNKGAGVTGIVTPQFDPFDIDYVCHEIGHQFSAGHTYYNACFGSKVTEDYETGSASTIMGYAGICAPNVQSNSDAYFHVRSIEQMTNAISGHTCEVETTSINNAPVANSGGNYSIPKNTPFSLDGSATTDSDSADVLTYCWEQFNNDGTFVQPPVNTSTGGPIFRSFLPITSPIRTFPNLVSIINNETPTWEVLPNVARTLNFKLTVRDNNISGGRTNIASSIITVGNVGPFLVTSPNTSTTWYVGESKTILWNVASTNTATYATNVAIKLSTDGGLTYPTTLIASTPNDGSQSIVVPNQIGTKNRIKIEAVGNIFFDISNANFEIKTNTFELTTTQATVSSCKPASATYTINYSPSPGYTENVVFSAVGLPSGATASFSPTSRTSAGVVTVTINNTTNVAVNNHSFQIKGTGTTANVSLPVFLKVFDNTIENVSLTSPINGAPNQQTSALLTWNAITSASSYLIEIATNPNFTNLVETATVNDNQYQTVNLAAGTINYWRVKPINSCTTGEYSESFTFQIAADVCKSYSNVYFENNDNTWNTRSNNAVSARIDIPDNIIISDLNFYMNATHPLISDIKMQFSGPTGVFTEIYNRDCAGANIDVTFDDSGSAIPVPCPGTLSGTRQASQPLAKFNNTSSKGTWVLLATDRVSNQSGGTFSQLRIDICGKLQYVNDITLTNNTGATVTRTQSTVLSQTQLKATQPNASAIQLIYTITKIPKNGILKKSTTTLGIGDTFTQDDINTNKIVYTNSGAITSADSFTVAISGINNAFIGGQNININVICGAAATISTITPNTKTTNSDDFVLTVNGTNFINGDSVIKWNGLNKTTTFINSTQLQTTILNSDITTSGNKPVIVFNTCNNTSSNIINFNVSGTLSTSIFDSSEFAIFPNPFKNQITIQVPKSVTEKHVYIQLYDFSGKQLIEVKKTIENYNITVNNVENLPDGSYILTVLNSNRKILVKRTVVKIK